MQRSYHRPLSALLLWVLVATLISLIHNMSFLCDGFVITFTRPPKRIILYGQSFTQEDNNENSEGVVSVNIQRILPNVTPYEAREAWIEYHWKKGGGLPIFILSDNGNQTSLERTILPIFMKERAEYDDNKTPTDAKKKVLDLQYTVTDAGPFFADLIPGSHIANVMFEEDDGSTCTTMNWDVTFTTSRWSSIYDRVTQFTIGTAATTVQEAAATPRLFSMTTTLDGSKFSLDPVVSRAKCLDFVFAKGGGLTLPPPIPFGDVLSEGNGAARQKLLRIPPFIVESIVDTQTSSDGLLAEFTYRLNDPGWTTFPFLLHTHLGRVRFTKDPNESSSSPAGGLVIDWEVEIRPYNRVTYALMEKLVEMTVSTILRNIRIHLTEPDAKVIIKPPRGGGGTNTNKSFGGKVAKDTWLGGVLNAHLSDTRSTVDQTISLFQPWTWGRSGKGDREDVVLFQWTDGHISIIEE